MRLIIAFRIVLCTMIAIVRYPAEIVIDILVVDRSSPSAGCGSNRRRRRSGVPSCHDLKGGQ